jgi:hypothetical protein
MAVAGRPPAPGVGRRCDGGWRLARTPATCRAIRRHRHSHRLPSRTASRSAHCRRQDRGAVVAMAMRRWHQGSLLGSFRERQPAESDGDRNFQQRCQIRTSAPGSHLTCTTCILTAIAASGRSGTGAAHGLALTQRSAQHPCKTADGCRVDELVSALRSTIRLEAENTAPRHQVIVLQRRVRGRPEFTNGNRLRTPPEEWPRQPIRPRASASRIRPSAPRKPWRHGWQSHPSRQATGNRRARDATPSTAPARPPSGREERPTR